MAELGGCKVRALADGRKFLLKRTEIQLLVILLPLHVHLSVMRRANSILVFACCFYMHWEVSRVMLGIMHHAHLVLHTYTLFHPPYH